MSSPVPPPRFELADIFPEMGEIEARAAQDLPAALALVAGYRALGPDDHLAAVDALVEVADLDEPLETHLSSHPQDREARTARAARLAAPEAASASTELLVRAEGDLVRLCAQDPGDATAWTLRLRTARGLALDPSEGRRRWLRARALAPHAVRPPREYLRHLTPAAGGGWDLVHAHVREMVATAPPGSAEWSLVPYAHLVRWHDDVDGGGRDLLRDPDVVAAVEQAADRFLAAPCPSRFGAVRAHTDFAVALGIAGRRGRAAAHFARLGPALDPESWALGADHRADLETIRSSALAEERRR